MAALVAGAESRRTDSLLILFTRISIKQTRRSNIKLKRIFNVKTTECQVS